MGRVKLHLVRYMGTYTILMFVSFLLWQAAGCPTGSLSVGVSAWDAAFAAGAAGINLEDQFFPKRCGHMGGKQIIPFEEAVKKIEAAAAARKDKDFVINARTDAIAVAGVDEAIRRGNAFAKAGADLIFVEAPTDPVAPRMVIERCIVIPRSSAAR